MGMRKLLNSFSKRIYTILFVFSFCLLEITAQRITCPSCGGSGGYLTMVGVMKCPQCWGQGTIADPHYRNQQAASKGTGMGLCMRGQVMLSKGNYEEAFNLFKEAVSDYYNIEATFYLGACIELGIGVTPDKDVAKEAYTIGSGENDVNCRNALKRIKEQGFWEATENNRQAFCQLVKINLDAEAAVWSNVETQTSSERRSSSRARRICSYCNGTKYELKSYRYSASADSYHNPAGTSCSYCGKRSEHYHYRCHYCNADGYVD